ncbi:unnamed protein product, partial [Discosporangium mesarthrocarpum]
AEGDHRREEEDTRRRLSSETERWQRKVLDRVREEAKEREDRRRREFRDRCAEELSMVVRRLEAEADLERKSSRAEVRRDLQGTASDHAQILERAQARETNAMEK